MPFPWKKNRVTRISQIVADLQSPKRGGSLVVETGFPTSLIDLFVKNRSRFKKTRLKKPVHSELPDPPPPPPPPSPATSPPPMPTVLESPVLTPFIVETADVLPVPVPVGKCGSSSRVTMVFVKILVVAVLVARVKKLTVGITLSAFALLFLEYAGKRVVSFMGPCSDASVAMESLFGRVQKLLLLQLKTKECEPEPASAQNGEADLKLNSMEIEIVEANIDDEITWGCSNLAEIDSSKVEVLEPCPCEIPECKIRGSFSGRFKSKMVKKLVPRKFRSSKKEKKEKGNKIIEAESGSEFSSAVEEDKLPSFEIEEELEDIEKEEENRSKAKPEGRRDDEVGGGITCSQESVIAREVVTMKRIERVGNSGYAILLIIALVGLVAGRFQALILTMTWCFLLKIVKVLCR